LPIGASYVWERMFRYKGKRCERDKDSTEPSQQHIGVVSIGGEAKLATEPPQPGRSIACSHVARWYERARQQRQHSQTAHSLHGVHPDVLDVESVLLVEAISVLHLGGALGGHIRDQSQASSCPRPFLHTTRAQRP
jgi:hypothetical protein